MLLVRGDVLIHAITRRRESYRRSRGIGPPHRCDKAVAAPGYRLNAAALGAIAVQDAAQRGDLNREVVIINDDARPGGGHDLVFREQRALPIGEDR